MPIVTTGVNISEVTLVALWITPGAKVTLGNFLMIGETGGDTWINL
jgi:hypothetical protein